jgi:hypothetical protein
MALAGWALLLLYPGPAVPGSSFPPPALRSASLAALLISFFAFAPILGVGEEVVVGVVEVGVTLGFVVVGVACAPAVPVVAVLVVWLPTPGRALPGVLVVGVLGVIAAGVVVTVLVIAGTGAEPPARSISAAASTPRASASTAANTPIGPFQLGDAARRVRAAAPQLRHQACSGCIAVPQRGQASPSGVGEAGVADVPPLVGCEVAALTSPALED